MENRDLQGSWGGATVRQDYAMMMMMIYSFIYCYFNILEYIFIVIILVFIFDTVCCAKMRKQP